MSSRGWVPFLQDYRIPYKKSSGDNVEIRCCLCTDDHSTNLGLSTKSSAWNCWRNTSHRGYSPIRIIRGLLGCSNSDAVEIAHRYFEWESRTAVGDVDKQIEWVEIPEDFHEFSFKHEHENVFLSYIRKRGLDPHYCINRFQLRYALSGKYHHRLIIPIIQDGHWYSWVARTISHSESIRYLAADAKDVKSQPYNHIFDYDNLLGGRLLVIGEGSFDGIAVTASMTPGVHGTALFGKQITHTQIKLLREVAARYDKVALGLDPDALKDSVHMIEQLRWFLPDIFSIQPTAKDWGDMTASGMRQLFCETLAV